MSQPDLIEYELHVPIDDGHIDEVINGDNQHIATSFFRRLCLQAKEANRMRAQRADTPEAKDSCVTVPRELLYSDTFIPIGRQSVQIMFKDAEARDKWLAAAEGK